MTAMQNRYKSLLMLFIMLTVMVRSAYPHHHHDGQENTTIAAHTHDGHTHHHAPSKEENESEEKPFWDQIFSYHGHTASVEQIIPGEVSPSGTKNQPNTHKVMFVEKPSLAFLCSDHNLHRRFLFRIPAYQNPLYSSDPQRGPPHVEY